MTYLELKIQKAKEFSRTKRVNGDVMSADIIDQLIAIIEREIQGKKP